MKKSLIHTVALGLSCALSLGVVTTYVATSRPAVEARAAYTVLEHVDFTRPPTACIRSASAVMASKNILSSRSMYISFDFVIRFVYLSFPG